MNSPQTHPFLNNNPPGLNNPALHSPATPLAEAPPGVQQVSQAPNPFPITIQDLLSQKIKKRPSIILSIPAKPQQDDGFSALAKDKTLDEASRLAAATKIQDNQKRDTILAELAQDKALDDNLRLKAADKILDLHQKIDVFSSLAQDQSLGKTARLEAKAFTELKINFDAPKQNVADSIPQDQTIAVPSPINPGESLAPGATPEEALALAQAQNSAISSLNPPPPPSP